MNYTREEQAAHRAMLVEALRSGKYSQTTCRLRRKDSFCCLGVACDISGLGRWEQNENYWEQYICPTTTESAVLPREVQDWLGFRSCAGEFAVQNYPADYNYYSLSELNDSGVSFSTIANIIERGLVECV